MDYDTCDSFEKALLDKNQTKPNKQKNPGHSNGESKYQTQKWRSYGKDTCRIIESKEILT